MSRIKTSLAYGWAALAVPLVLGTFMGMERLAGGLVAVTGLHVHPIYTGGEVAQTIDHGVYQTLIHRPVFDGLIGQRKTGFVQIKWQLKDPNLPGLPEAIDEQIDFDADGANDLRIHVDTATQETRIEPLDARVLSASNVIAVSNGRIVRVNLRRTPQ
jgi:hypothetical protein